MTNYLKKVVKGAGIVFFLTVLSSFFGYLLRLVLVRELTPADYGLFYAVFTLVGFLWLFKHFGLNSALTKFVAEFMVKKQYSKIKSSIVSVFILELCYAGIISLVLIILSKFLAISYFKSISAQQVLIVLVAYFFISIITDILVHVFLGFQRSEYYALYFTLQNFVVLAFVFLFTPKFGVLSPALGYLLSSIVLSTIFSILFLKIFPFFKYKFKWSTPLVKRLMVFGVSVVLAMIGGKIIGYTDTLLLTYFRTLDEVGIYNAVLPTSLLLTIFGNSLAIVLFPMASELWTKRMKKELAYGINLVNKYAFVFIVPIGLTLLSFPDIVLRVLFGHYYTQGSFAMQILVIGALFYAVASINTNILSGIGKPKHVAKILLTSAMLNIIANLTLIPFFGIIGAAFATSISYLTMLLLSSYWLSKFVRAKPLWFPWLKTFFCGGIFVGTIYFLKRILEFNLWLEMCIVISISLIIYVLLLFLFKLVNLKELNDLIKNVI